jgi:quercetin dioxygenase-like cupin family protein
MFTSGQRHFAGAAITAAALLVGSLKAQSLSSNAALLKMLPQVKAAEGMKDGPDPATLAFTRPDQMKWTENPNNGVLTSVVYGNTEKEGLYIVLVKWPAHKMSHPHFHPNDRFVTVLSGTWWVGTGTKFDPDHTVPLKAGTFVTHYGNHVHYDGAKDEDCVLEIVGMGPATITPAEVK